MVRLRRLQIRMGFVKGKWSKEEARRQWEELKMQGEV
jgi:hypothetical protein